jgi:ParB family transcriptional regulator, chromosome partitioning protein
VARRKSLLRDLAVRPRGEGLSADKDPAPGLLEPMTGVGLERQVLELDPASVHIGGLPDRFEIDADLQPLVDSIRTLRQGMPIIVRPHSGLQDTFEIVAGRRRLLACRHLGIPVKAVVRDIEEDVAIMSQAAENIVRENLSYIERARLAARMVDDAGLDPSQVEQAFQCGPPERSRYLKIGRGIPGDIAAMIGKAPEIGRPRWEKLADILAADPGAITRVRDALSADNEEGHGALNSNERFKIAHRAGSQSGGTAMSRPDGSSKPVRVALGPVGRSVAKIEKRAEGVRVTFDRAPEDGFVDWLMDHGESALDALLREFRRHAKYGTDLPTTKSDEHP